MKVTPLKAIRKYCLACNGTAKEVRLCPVTDCPLYPFRLGKGQGKGSRLKAIRARCLDCAGTIAIVKNCPIEDCSLRPYRVGKNLALVGKRGKGNPDIALFKKNSLNHCTISQQTVVNL